MTQVPALAVFLFVPICLSWHAALAETYEVTAFHINGVNATMCSDTPDSLYIEEVSSCSGRECVINPLYTNDSANSTYCTSDYRADVQEVLGDTEYGHVLAEYYNDSDCLVLSFARATKLTSSSYCQKVPRKYPEYISYQWIELGDDGTITIDDYMDETCSTYEKYRTVSTRFNVCSALKSTVSSTIPAAYSYVLFRDENITTSSSGSSTSNSGESSSSSTSSNEFSTSSNSDSVVSLKNSGLSMEATVGITAVAIVAVVVLLATLMQDEIHSMTSKGQRQIHKVVLLTVVSDSVITAARVPRDKVRVGKLVSRGAYGEVYTGIFNDEQVAVKMLPPESRKSIPQVNAFLAEVKTTATMEHPCIVTFVGVAWDSLADLCVVMEFMEGGDLRSLLNKFEASRHPVGFNRQKITIALHVCHALTYMHSMSPVVIHRDLKSRNILLSSDHQQAKLTDFGISRERLDSTMTAGVGTSLWMAPEVMLGERYDEKADMFSFGVVLSELDVHSMPYENSRAQSRESSGREMGDAVLFQKVASGAVRVEFSAYGPQSMVDLGVACVSVDPKQRPSAAEALYRLQVILRQGLP